MARRKRAKSDRTGPIWSRIVRRMVVVFRAKNAQNALLFSKVKGPGEKVRRLDGGAVRIRTGGGCSAGSVQMATFSLSSGNLSASNARRC